MNFDKITPCVQHVENNRFMKLSRSVTETKLSYTYRFIVITEGGFTLPDNGREEVCPAGDLLYLPAKCEYTTTFTPPGFCCINIAFDMIREAERKSIRPGWFQCRTDETKRADWFSTLLTFEDMPEFNEKFVAHNFPGAISHARRCLSLWQSSDRFARLALNASLTEFIAGVAGYLDKAKQHPRSVIAARIQDYIDTHVSERLTCQNIADVFSYHTSYLNRIMREFCGCSLHDAIVSAKIRSATQLLLDSDMSIADIAYHLAFYDSAHFTKTFYEATGRHPSDVRKKEL